MDAACMMYYTIYDSYDDWNMERQNACQHGTTYNPPHLKHKKDSIF